MAEKNDRARDRSHLLVEAVEAVEAETPGQDLVRQEDRSRLVDALANLPVADRDLLLAHEVEGQDTLTLAADRGSTPGAVAARLNRARANLRIEYLLVEEKIDLPSDRCRPVLRALSLGDRRRQRELDVDRHVLGCPACARVRVRLLEHRSDQSGADGAVRVPVARDADVVQARQKGREVAAAVGFSATELTLIATAISEIARNIVKFAERGEVVITPVSDGHRRGIHVLVRDVGVGIADPGRAMEDGYSTYHGLGLGLPGAKRLMDSFELSSTAGEGTTVTMEKWLRSPVPLNADPPSTTKGPPHD
jgi:serine/threonine-protein kinase RsbT